MFTAISLFSLVFMVWFANRREWDERRQQAAPEDDDFLRARILFIRQDLRLVIYLLVGIMVMLGVVADRMH